jgi:peptidoglycan hydrolase-like protein with peptidoglycan-binding domain
MRKEETMPKLSYNIEGLVIEMGGTKGTEEQIRDIQRDLRRLGYLKAGIDGKFGRVTELAIKALQYDLLQNDGRSQRDDGDAPVRVLDYNRGRVVAVTGVVDQALAACIADILGDPEFPNLHKAEDPKAENNKILDSLKKLASQPVPIPFLVAILRQESGLKHFNEPKKNDEDTYITVGLDKNATEKYIITSRGYGVGQYTLFHHPPKKEEMKDFMFDVGKNVQKAVKELRYKFDNFVNGTTTGTRADDRISEYGNGPLRCCKYLPEDPPYMKGCKQCMIDAGQKDIAEGTSVFKGSSIKFVSTDYYKKASYPSVPIRKNIACDWPYAARRYNGAGINSYHYQTIVLKNVLDL